MKNTAALILLFFGSVATAQDRPTITAQPNTVFVGADGKFEANPDTAVMQFNISAQETTSREAYDRASKSAEQVRRIARTARFGITARGDTLVVTADSLDLRETSDGVERTIDVDAAETLSG